MERSVWMKGSEVGPGLWVLVQGIGGVSITFLQLAIAAGAKVIATTSSQEKATRLKALGATHVINYRTISDRGEEARRLTLGGIGSDFVIDFGGNETPPQTLVAVEVDGIDLTVGGVGGTPISCLCLRFCCIAALFVGFLQLVATNFESWFASLTRRIVCLR